MRKTPKIRFKKFTGDWEQQSWEDVIEMPIESVDPKKTPYSGMPHIHPGNIEPFTGILLENVRSAKEDGVVGEKFYLRKGEIAYGKINPEFGKVVISGFDATCSADMCVLKATGKLKQKFLFRVLQTKHFYKFSVAFSQGVLFPRINRTELKKYKFLMPCEDEQLYIGNFFRTFDDIIALKKREVEKLEKLKEAYLQQMFAQGDTK